MVNYCFYDSQKMFKNQQKESFSAALNILITFIFYDIAFAHHRVSDKNLNKSYKTLTMIRLSYNLT